MTFLGNAGPWQDRIYLVGGLAPRYIVGKPPEGAPVHIGTTDVDLVIELVVDDESFDAYRTLARNLKDAGFKPISSSRWASTVDGVKVVLDFLCDTDAVGPGKIFMPRGQAVGNKMGAYNIPGSALAALDYTEHELEADRNDGTGRSRVTLKVVGLLPFVVLKARAFQARHSNKDAYDLVYCLLNFGQGPTDAAAVAAVSPTRSNAIIIDGLKLLEERFAGVEQDGPGAYAAFLADEGDPDAADRLRQEAVTTVRQFMAAYRRALNT